MNFGDTFRDKTVFVTGHTGFKGSWLCEWLLLLGARVVGFSLDPPTNPSLFDQLALGPRLTADLRGDIRNIEPVQKALGDAKPDFVFHLAAQAIVRTGYSHPLDTVATNAMGTLHVLEALRREGRPCVAILVTTDKCYENREWLYGYREADGLGGYDPYSASKACAELLISAYRRSFFTINRGSETSLDLPVASVRAGNVIGGGDWALDRIVPDCVRSLERKATIPVRNAGAMRPWQHVLEPLGGYLLLAAEIRRRWTSSDPDVLRDLPDLCTAFNFGPTLLSNRTVAELVREILRHWPGRWEDRSVGAAFHEAGKLSLSIDRAYHLLGWHPCWHFEKAVEETIRWYRQASEWKGDHEFVRELTKSQIEDYTRSCAVRSACL